MRTQFSWTDFNELFHELKHFIWLKIDSGRCVGRSAYEYRCVPFVNVYVETVEADLYYYAYAYSSNGSIEKWAVKCFSFASACQYSRAMTWYIEDG